MSDSDSQRGLYRKYTIERTDGSSGPGGKHEHCNYFVLDLVHDKHAIPALEAYAESCCREFPSLYDDLNDRLAKLSQHRKCAPLRQRVEGKPGGELPDCNEPAVIPLGNGCWFCIEHAQDWEARAYPLTHIGKGTLKRRLARQEAR